MLKGVDMENAYWEAIDAAYFALEEKKAEVAAILLRNRYRTSESWYNGHYRKNAIGEWIRESYPIPVLTVLGLCDIEIEFDKISVSTKLERGRAMEYDYEKLNEFTFEAYGVEDYLMDFYQSGQNFRKIKANVEKSGEAEVGYSFLLPTEICEDELVKLLTLLDQEGFYI